MKKVPKLKCFVNAEQVKQKKAEALKGIKINEFKNSWAVQKHPNRCIPPNGEYFNVTEI